MTDQSECRISAPAAALSAPAPSLPPSYDLTRQAGRGAIWSIGGGVALTLLRLGSSVFLARMLTPRDFGVFGMALLVLEMIRQFGALGVGTGLIAKKDADQLDLSTAFWTNLPVQCLLYGVAFAAAPWVAGFFRTSELTPILRIVAVTFLFTAVSAVPETLLRKQLRFGVLTGIQVGSILLESAVAVALAVCVRRDHWALVTAMLVGGVALHGGFVVLARWRPSLQFDWGRFRYLFRFSANGLGFSVVNYLHANVDYLLVSRLLGAAQLGLYEFAFRVPHLVYERLARPAGTVVFPVLCRIQADDARVAGGYVKAAKYIALMVFPLLAGLAVLARPAIQVLWGPQWLAMVVPLQILCARAAVCSIMTPIGSVFLCKDRPDIPFKFSLAALAITFAAVWLLGRMLGLLGVALGMAVSVLPFFLLLWLAFRMTRTSVLLMARALAPCGVATGVLAAATFAARRLAEAAGAGEPAVLGCGILAGAAAYLGTICLLPGQFREIRQTAIVMGGRGLATA